MFKQLPLSVNLHVDATFDNFYVSGSNQVAVDALRHFCLSPQEHFFYVWGTGGSGISHLLHAVQHHTESMSVQYLPLAELLSSDVEYHAEDIFSGLELFDLIVVDDLQKLAGVERWEHSFFHLYNRLRDMGKQLLVGANTSSRELAIALPDLQSRLQWGMSYQLHALNDDEKKLAILSRAEAMGMRLGEDVLQFMLTHYSRDLRGLMGSLDQLDKASLAQQRHLTIPFVKQVILL